ncbi:MAG: hypothetical protein FWH23_07345 [Bacteroidales bacterium]|nr:hypothetical protein [Bacteroidales bacterium]
MQKMNDREYKNLPSVMRYLSFSYNFRTLLCVTMFLFCGLSGKAQQLDTAVVPITQGHFADTTVLTTDIEDIFRLSDEELRVLITRIMYYGSHERSMRNDPFFAPGTRYYELFKEERPLQLFSELPVAKAIQGQLQLDLNNARKAAAAGRVYWWLQWLLIFL